VTPANAQPHDADKEVSHEHAPAVTKEDMQKALEAVRARRHGPPPPPALQPKPERKAVPPLPSMEELEDIVEDEEAYAPPVKQQGFGPQVQGECPPMKTLVQRKVSKAPADAPPSGQRKAGVQGPIF